MPKLDPELSFGTLVVLLILFFTLTLFKLTGLVELSWWLVSAPLLLVPGFILLVLTVVFLLAVGMGIKEMLTGLKSLIK